MKCRKCGQEIPVNLLKLDSFKCPSCGNQYRRRQASENSYKQAKSVDRKRTPFAFLRKKVWKFPVWSLLLLAFVIILAAGSGSGKQPEGKDFEVALEVASRAESGVVFFEIQTNMPDETEFMLTLTQEGFMAQDKAIVSAGKATSSGFTNKGDPLSGHYELTVSTSIPSLQSETARQVIGQNGEHMLGKYVVDTATASGKRVEGIFEFDF
ncbi:MAG: hypothetical protein IJ646_13325 [Clostridia bacterium]|nr:hypothetical protein [Clostridia bacterium]